MARHRELLAVRAILVGTRAAVHSHRASSRPELILGTAERGLALIDELSAELPEDAEPDIREAAAEARAEIAGILETASDEGQLIPRG